MIFEKKDKFLLILANVIYAGYIIFLSTSVNSFNAYITNEFKRARLVDRIREQTKLTLDSANISTKDLHYIVEMMAKLSYLYLALIIILYLFLLFIVWKKNINHNIVAFIFLVYSILVLIFSLGILFISCIIYFYLGIKLILKNDPTTNKKVIWKN